MSFFIKSSLISFIIATILVVASIIAQPISDPAITPALQGQIIGALILLFTAGIEICILLITGLVVVFSREFKSERK